MLPALSLALSITLASVMGQQDCICYPYNGNYDDIVCEDPSLTYIPECVPDDVPILSITTPSIPLIPETIRRFTNLKRLTVARFDGPIISENFFLYQRNLETLYVWGTDIDFVDYRWFKYAPALKAVSFDHNKISSLAENTFSYLPLLWRLDINNNLLTTLPANIFEGTSLSVLRFDNNPWHCECELMKTLQWLKDHGVSMTDNALCWQPLELRGLNLLDLTPELACNLH